MRTFIYIGTGLWICVGLGLFVWISALSAQLMNNRLPKPGVTPPFIMKSADPADYTELGQQYLKKVNRAYFILLGYLVTLFIVISKAM
jgi:hypothetical protein